MNLEFVYYQSFTGINPMEKKGLVDFLERNTNKNRDEIVSALDYALKLRPSFGGFVLTAKLNGLVQATLIACKTGMEGFSSHYLYAILGFNASLPEWEDVCKAILHRSLVYTAGLSVSIQSTPEDALSSVLEAEGFKKKYDLYVLN